MYYSKIYCTLPEDAKRIRETVFMKEQGFTIEFDDKDEKATHLVLYTEADTAVGTGRFFKEEGQTYVIGRIAVLKAFRKHHCGAILLQEAERQIRALGAKEIRLSAQVQAKGFYEKSGYTAEGEEFLDEHCPHIWMHKAL